MTNEQCHDAIYNEGGEGFNPYRTMPQGPEFGPPTRDERKSEISRLISLIGTQEHRQDEKLALYDERDAIEAAEAREFRAEWTPETTKTRRAAWNAKVDAGQIKTARDVADFRRANGWGLGELKKTASF